MKALTDIQWSAKHKYDSNIKLHCTRLTALCPGLHMWAGTRKVKLIWILLKQETVSGSGISWAICKSARCSRQITMPAPHHSVFYRPDALPAAQPTASKHWRHDPNMKNTAKPEVDRKLARNASIYLHAHRDAQRTANLKTKCCHGPQDGWWMHKNGRINKLAIRPVPW